MRTTEARVLHTPRDEFDRFLPEGPQEMTLAGIPRVVWVNIQDGPSSTRGWIHNLSALGSGAIAAPRRVGFLRPVAGKEQLLIGLEKHLAVFTFRSGTFQTLATIPDDNPRTIINDAEVVPGGEAVVFGTKDVQFDPEAKLAHLYLYTVADNRVSVLADKQVCSNGKVFATDARGLVLYDIDTPTRKVVRYRLDVGARTATLDGTALDLSREVGFPDGMCDCGDGSVIVAFYNPDFAEKGRAVRYSLTTGEAVEEWLTPGSPRVTCPLLVKRPDGVKLVLTTATEGMPAELRARCLNAGALFIADTQLADCPAGEKVLV
ncbi:MAG: SMP-30/gluconolactonase/LRE family protein [Gemmataceae bacterium]|nr:SMP-30/gluconolactonase/LRE family protein [Gemmataceae bacterium]